jgi:PrtD family type I secretion system ABC transporter
MQKKLTFGSRYILFAAVFISCANLIYLSVPIYMMIVYDKVLYSFSRSSLYALSVGLLIALAAMVLIGYLQRRLMMHAGNKLVRDTIPFALETMRTDVVGNRQTGYTRALEDLETVRDGAIRGYLFAFLDLPWIVIYLGVLIIIHPVVGLLAGALVFLAAMFQILLKTAVRKRYAAADVSLRAGADFAGDCLKQARLLSGMQMLPALIRLYRQREQTAWTARAGADALYTGIGSLIRLVHLAGPAVVFSAGVFVFFNEEISVGAIVAALAIGFRLFYCFDRRLANLPAAVSTAAAYKRLRTFVNIQPPERKLSLPEPEGQFDGQGIVLTLGGRPVLHNISFDLAPGERLGISGPSGAGKTCLCRVMTGIWSPAAGKIRLEGAELSQWPDSDLGRYMGYLPQKPVLFPVTVARNISRLLDPDPDKVVAAAGKAGIHEMILALPKGYDTLIEANGSNLAAGQCQSICLARALYDDPKVVVLDEPHTFLDDQGVQALMTCLDRLRESGTTLVMVSDRPRMLKKMDKLLMIKEGRSLTYGPAAQVLAQLSDRQPAQQTTGV